MTLDSQQHKEFEVKLELDELVYQELLKKHPAFRQIEQDNWFFDSLDKTLQSNLWALRLRFEKGQSFLTAKGPLEKKSSIHIRPEFEESIPIQEGKALLNGFYLEGKNFLPCRELEQRFSGLLVKPILNFKNLRKYSIWGNYTLELDKCTIGGHTWFELEIEIKPQEEQDVLQSLDAMFKKQGWPLRYSKTNKFIKAMQLKNQHEQ